MTVCTRGFLPRIRFTCLRTTSLISSLDSSHSSRVPGRSSAIRSFTRSFDDVQKFGFHFLEGHAGRVKLGDRKSIGPLSTWTPSTTVTIPTSDNTRRSRSTSFPTSPHPLCRERIPGQPRVFPEPAHGHAKSRPRSPFCTTRTRSWGIPSSTARPACRRRWRYSPCMGMKYRGFTRRIRYLSSSSLACPDTWTWEIFSYRARAPRRQNSLMIWLIAFSFPGINRDEKTTTSPGLTLRYLCRSEAIRERADMGSPWDPVERITISSSGWESISFMSTKRSGGNVQVSALGSNAGVLDHGPADQDDFPAELMGEIQYLLNPVGYSKRERGNEQALRGPHEK